MKSFQKLVFLVSLICLSLYGYSQDSLVVSGVYLDPKGYVGISFGPSYPLGIYKSDSYSDENAGFAMTGVHVNLIQGGYVFAHNIGVAFSYGAGVNNFNGNSYIENYADLDAAKRYVVKATSWSYGTVTAGLLLSFPLNNLCFDFRAMGGYSSATSPRIQLTEEDGLVAPLYKLQEEAKSGAFCMEFGTSVRLLLTKRLYTVVNMDYLMANHEFKLATNTINLASSINTEITVFHLSAGVGYLLY